MPIPHQALTESPAAVTGVSDDTPYTLQNKSQRGMWILDDAAAAPADASDTDGAFLLAPFGFGTFSNSAGNDTYIWLHEDGMGLGSVSISEAA